MVLCICKSPCEELVPSCMDSLDDSHIPQTIGSNSHGCQAFGTDVAVYQIQMIPNPEGNKWFVNGHRKAESTGRLQV